MKIIRISAADYRRLQKLGSDKWMADQGEQIEPKKVIHDLIDSEYRKAFPPPPPDYDR